MLELGALKVAKEVYTGALTVATDWLKAAFIGGNCKPSWRCKVYLNSSERGQLRARFQAYCSCKGLCRGLSTQRALFELTRPAEGSVRFDTQRNRSSSVAWQRAQWALVTSPVLERHLNGLAASLRSLDTRNSLKL